MRKNNFVDDWSKVIRNMKLKVEHYYLKSDKERKQPYKVTGISKHFDTKAAEFVHFYPLRTDECENYVLEKALFVEHFVQVTEEN
ncbi:hypothetical protein [Bacillus cereus]|uniref:hypothetical protein n=1 Tax=Bacillus cereus TaxID=1396 RepID=UPI0013D8D605|nr:hypothetical protein [Bacillus cereus]